MGELTQRNIERCLEFMKDSNPKNAYNKVVLGIKTEEEFTFRLNLLPDEPKNIIVAKWGLDGSKYCQSFKALDEKLGIENSREVYTDALFQLAKTRALITKFDGKLNCVFNDYTTSEFKKFCALASLRATLLGTWDAKPCDVTIEEFTKILEDVFNTLSEREVKVLRFRFGLDGGKAMTLEETGKEFSVTRVRIRQIEAKALRKLRHPSRSHYL